MAIHMKIMIYSVLTFCRVEPQQCLRSRLGRWRRERMSRRKQDILLLRAEMSSVPKASDKDIIQLDVSNTLPKPDFIVLLIPHCMLLLPKEVFAGFLELR